MKALDIIKAMPISEELKMQIVNRYDYLPPSEKLVIDHMAWSTFYNLYEETIDDNLGIQYNNVKKGTDHFGGDFYKRAADKSENQMLNDLEESLAKADLSIARKAMEQIMNEIHASKKSGHHKKNLSS